MGQIDIEATARSTAGPPVLYALLRDGSTWPAWSPIGSFELESPGDGDPEGLGAVRLFRTGTVTSRERVVELVPDRRFSYELLGGLPVRGYRADVDLSPVPGGGTDVRWHSTFRPALPGTGWFWRRFLRRVITQAAEGLAAHAGTT